MSTFESFFKELTSEEQWFENVSLRHKPETFKTVCKLVWTLALADANQMKVTPMSEHRRHVVYKLSKILPDKDNSKQWFQLEAEKKEEEVKQILTYTKEHADKCAAEALEIIKNSKMISSMPRIPYKQQVEEGGWIPKKPAPYPMTTAMEAYNKERKIAYYRYCFDPITRDKLPTWMEEEVYNDEFDRIMIKEKKHPHWETLQEIH